MLTVLAALGVLVVLFVAGAVATREDQAMQPAPGDRADLELPSRALRAADLEAVRFGVTVRGYRMSEVDDLLARLASELAERDDRIAELASPEQGASELAPQPSAMGASSMLTAPVAADLPAGTDLTEPAGPASATGDVHFPDVLPADPAGGPEQTARD